MINTKFNILVGILFHTRTPMNSMKAFRFSAIQTVIFPLVFFVFQLLLKADYTLFYLSAHDPAYAFLFNGLNIALGNFELGLSGFPGTTLQCLVALNLTVYDWFSNAPLKEAVLQNPEFFLNLVSCEILVLNTLALFFLGWITFRRFQNLSLSIALQLTPFISLKTFSMNTVVMLEPLMLCFELLLITIIASYAYGTAGSLNRRQVLWTAIPVALGISTKTVFLPVALLPLFAIKGGKRKLLYAGIVLFSLALFLIPIYPTFSTFLGWYKQILTHTGDYGTGSYSVFDAALYAQNLWLSLRSNVVFTLALVLSILVSAATLLRMINWADVNKKRIVSGLTLVFVMNILMVAKHFSAHYLAVSYNLSVFAIVVMASALPVRSWPVFRNSAAKLVLVYLTGIALVVSLVIRTGFSENFENPRLDGVKYVQSLGQEQRIIILENAGPFIEVGLYHGLAYSEGMKPEYASVLKRLWPDTYFYHCGADVLMDWMSEHSFADVLSRSPVTHVYYYSKTDTLCTGFANRLQNQGISHIKAGYKDTSFREYIYEIHPDTAMLNRGIALTDSIFCDFEAKNDSIGYRAGQYFLTPARYQSGEAAFDGLFSIKLDKENPYGPGIKIKGQKGFYKISVMQKGDHGFVVADGSLFYKAGYIPSAQNKGWNRIELSFDVTPAMEGSAIAVYLWYPGKEKCYFDHLTILHYSIEP